MTRAAFRATYSDMKLIRTRKVVQLVFEIPVEQWNDVAPVLGGMPNPAAEIWCAIARLEDNKPQPAAPEVKRADWNSLALAQQAGILCADRGFQSFLGTSNNSEAANEVRRRCEIGSRSDLSPDTAAGKLWTQLVTAYRAWAIAPACGVDP